MCILVADGHTLFRQGIALVLPNLFDGVAVVEARDAAEAEASLGERFDVILLDLAMPGMEGWAGLGRIRARAPGVPVAILSATDDADVVAEASPMRGGLHPQVVQRRDAAPRDFPLARGRDLRSGPRVARPLDRRGPDRERPRRQPQPAPAPSAGAHDQGPPQQGDRAPARRAGKHGQGAHQSDFRQDGRVQPSPGGAQGRRLGARRPSGPIHDS